MLQIVKKVDKAFIIFFLVSFIINFGVFFHFSPSRYVLAKNVKKHPHSTLIPTVFPTHTPMPTLAPSPTASPSPTLIIQSRVNPICVSSHLDRLSIEAIDKQLSLMQEAGIKWVRFDFVWAAMEKEKGRWDFSKYDHIINTAEAKGIHVIALLVQYEQPQYILQGRPRMSPASAQDYTYFATNVSAHFKGRIKLYELGNEPNMPMFWPPASDVNAYTELLKAGYTAIKQNDPQTKIISAGLAPVEDWRGFIHGMFKSGAQGHFDYMGFHPYSHPASPDKMTGTPFDNVATVMSIQQSYGDNKPIMGPEVGWPTFNGGVTESQQADYIGRVYQKIMFENYQYIPIACIYDFINDGTNASNPEDNFGIVRADYSLKPSFSTVKQMRLNYDSNFSTINP